ncbi:MAG: hypothetical protein BGO41_00435 [Clostridiales bacterium 38-18]|nr:MAG: hypothetical protein BGO41_00435 [Clostridiales bacterium 38-18]
MDGKYPLDNLVAFDDMIQRSERVLPKLKEGSSQQSLVKNRIKALKIAKMVCKAHTRDKVKATLKNTLEDNCDDGMSMNQFSDGYSIQEIENAIAPIQSLISKSEKVLLKVKPDSWQYRLTERNIIALKYALEMLKP